MSPEVEYAIEEIKALFDGHRIQVISEDQGGAHVIVHDLDVGAAYAPEMTWCGFTIPYTYPRAQVYPHYVDGSLQRADKAQFGGGFHPDQQWAPSGEGKVLMVSRSSKRWNPVVDTAASKLMQVIDWIGGQ